MKKTLKSLNGKKLNSSDLITLKGGKMIPGKTMIMTVRNGSSHDDGNEEDAGSSSL